MQRKFQRVALIGKYQSPSSPGSTGVSRSALEEVARFLRAQGCQVALEQQTVTNSGIRVDPDVQVLSVDEIGRSCDLGLVVGGDGTMLGIGRQIARHGVPLIGINHGRLGFMNDIPFGSFEPILVPMLAGEFVEEARSLMHARVLRDGHSVFEALAMNDVVVHRGGTSGMLELRVEVDGHFVANHRADGMIVASPTGSTAYSLASGGPILYPAIDGWVLVPIAPHTLSNRPVVVPDQSEVVLELVAAREASANFDMQSLASLHHGDRVVVTRSEHKVRFLHPRGWSYFDTLRRKLHWNEEVS